MRRAVLVAVLAASCARVEPRAAPAAAAAPAAPADDVLLGLRIGDALAGVVRRLELEEVPPLRSGGGTKQQLHLAAAGVRLFFEDDKLVMKRFDHPFAGEVEGIRIGASVDALLTKAGPPKREPWSFGRAHAFVYTSSIPTELVRFDVDDTTRAVVHIFVMSAGAGREDHRPEWAVR